MRQIRALHQRLWVIALVAVLSLLLSPAAFAATTVTDETELRNAVGQGSGAGDIKLGANITLTQTLDLGACTMGGSDRTVTIDLAGYELRYPKEKQGSAINVPPEYKLTLRDTSGRNAGSVTGAYRAIENHGTFQLTSGRLANNSGSCDGNGLFNAQGATATISGGIIEMNASEEGHCGGGIYNRGTLTLTSGTIQNNLTDARVEYEGGGGGIYNGDGGNLTVSGGVIQNNQSDYGGGIYNDPACEVMVLMGRARIQGNTAVRQGGGIYNGRAEDGTKLALLGGIISENTANLEGGGIMNAGTMAASLVNISKNKAGTEGGGIFNEGSLALSESPVVQGNKNGIGNDNDVYMKRDKTITIEGAFNNNAKIGIMCEDSHQVFTNGYGTFNSGDPSTYFIGNPNDNQKDILIRTQSTETGTEAQCVVVIHYLDEYGAEETCVEYEDVTSNTDRWGTWGETRWYVVRRDTTIDDYIGVRGDAHLILVSGKTLKTDEINVRRNDDDAETRAVFNVYNSTGDSDTGAMGHLIADGTDSSSAGIGYKANSGGVGTIIINGGDIKAYGGGDAAGIGGVENRGNGPITINGGRIYAEGGKHGAGIGGGQAGDQDNPINIYGGEVEAHGGSYAAGIGGGDSDHGGADGGEVSIYDAIVRAYGGEKGAGIGGGEDGEGGNVTIGGTANVYAEGGDEGSGIGGGQDGDYGGTLTVKSGYVKAVGGDQAAAIGGGEDCCGPDFQVFGGTVVVYSGEDCQTAIGAGDNDHHEGNKWFNDQAKVTAGQSEASAQVLPVNDRNSLIDNRYGAWKYEYLKIEPCDHAGATTYEDKNYQEHIVKSGCQWCGLSSEGTAAHSFNAESHTCVCGHKEIAIELKRNDTTTIETTYASEGSTYFFRSVKPTGTEAEKYFAGWKVTNLYGHAEDQTIYPGTTITVKPQADGPIVAVAQWSDEPHEHDFTYHAATAATCTGKGNVEYWVCDKGTHPCHGYFIRAKAGQTRDATVTLDGKQVYLVEVEQTAVVIPALGHDWGEATYTWSNNDTKCTAFHTCKRDAKHTATEVAQGDQIIQVSHDATCTKPARTLTLAIFREEGFVMQSKAVEKGAALGHNWKSPTYTWSQDNTSCTAQRVCANDANHTETETVQTTWTSEDATCTKAGSVTYTATFTEEPFATQTKTVAGRDPLKHNWDKPTYTWADDYSTCTAKRVCSNYAEHVETETVDAEKTVVKESTCTTPGETVYQAKFKNDAFSIQATSVITEPKGHKWPDTWTPVDSPTGDKNGLEQRVCENDPSHVQRHVIPKAGHTHSLTHVDATEPTCTTDGNTEYWVCSGDDSCGHFFSDKDGTTEIYEDDIVKPATGHNWGNPMYVWSADGMSAAAVRSCKTFSFHLQVGVGHITSVPGLRATCTTKGILLCMATFDNPAFTPQVKVVDVEPYGHEWNAWKQTTKPTCTEVGVETRVCERNAAHTETRELPSLGHDWGAWTVTTPATKTEDGVETRVCARCEAEETRVIPAGTHIHQMSFVEATNATCTEAGSIAHWACEGGIDPCGRHFADPEGKTELSDQSIVIPALGHDWGKPSYEWSDDGTTCTATHVCKRDANHVETEAVDTVAEIEKAASCTEGGRTRYTANFTKSGFSAQTKIVTMGARGHTPASAPRREGVKAPTCEEPGSYKAVTYCTVCKQQIGEPVIVMVPPAGHDWDEWATITEPTCTEGGTAQRTCKHDGKHKQEESIEALGHDWGEWQVTKPPTVDEDGEETCTCQREGCNVTKMNTIPKLEQGQDPKSLLWHVNEQEAACMEFGNIEYWVKFTTDEGGATQRTYYIRAKEGETSTENTTLNNESVPLREATWDDIIIPALGHDWGEGSYATDTDKPTCTTDGKLTYSCHRGNCGATKTEIVDPLGHMPTILTEIVLQKPSCEIAGFTWLVRSCANCHGEISRNLVRIDPLGHEWHEWEVTKDPTETEPGEMKRDCDLNPQEHQEVIVVPPLDHDWGEPTYTWSDDYSTCTVTRVCTHDHSHVQTEVVRKDTTPGTVSRVVDVVVSYPTCEESGEIIHTAWFDNPAFLPQTVRVEVPALGHDWGEWVVTKPATETEEGIETRTCARCGKTETRAIPKLVPGEIVYRCVTDEVVWTQGSSEPAVFTFKRNVGDEQTFAHFTGVAVDGVTIESAWYDAVSGSVVVSLKPEYLETLTVGNHSVQALFDDGGPAEGTLIVQAAPEDNTGTEQESGSEPAPEPEPAPPATPATGDGSVPAWLVLLLAGAGTALCIRGLRLRRRS